MNARKFYHSAAWQAVRKMVLLRDVYTCALCKQLTESPHVDHIKSREHYPQLELEPSNLRCLCHACHSRKTVQTDGGFGRGD